MNLSNLTPHSRWVKCLSWRMQVWEAVSIHTLQMLASVCHLQGALFPHLQRLYWHEDRRDYVAYLPILAPKNLRCLHVMSAVHLSQHRPNFLKNTYRLDHYQKLFPQLETLSFGHIRCVSGISDHLLRVFIPSDGLKSLTISTKLGYCSIFTLSQLPSLTILDIRADCEAVGSAVEHMVSVDEPCFPVLRNIKVAFDGLDTKVIEFFRVISSASLSTVTIIALDVISGRHLWSLFDIFARAQYSKSLRDMTTHISTRRNIPRWQDIADPRVKQSYTATYETLGPLLQLSNLENLAITFTYMLLDIPAMQKLARGLPHLVSLLMSTDLDRPASCAAVPRMPLDVLRIVAENSVELEHLSLSIDAGMPPTPLPSHWRSTSAVRTLSVGDSTIYSAEKVAQYLSRVFPALREVRFSSRQYDRESRRKMESRLYKWWQVNRILQVRLTRS